MRQHASCGKGRGLFIKNLRKTRYTDVLHSFFQAGARSKMLMISAPAFQYLYLFHGDDLVCVYTDPTLFFCLIFKTRLRSSFRGSTQTPHLRLFSSALILSVLSEDKINYVLSVHEM